MRPARFFAPSNGGGHHRQRPCLLLRGQGFRRHAGLVREALPACGGLLHVLRKGLSFQEQICRYYEDRYGLPIHRVPHFELSQFLRYGLYRPTDFSVPVVSVKDVYNYLRLNTDIWWIAAGERITDSVWRRAIIKSSGTIDEKRGRIYPVAEWRKEDVVAYIRQNKLKVGVESRKLGFSFGSLQAREVIPVKLHFPADFARIRAWFPFVEAGIVHHQIKEERRGRETQQVPEV